MQKRPREHETTPDLLAVVVAFNDVGRLANFAGAAVFRVECGEDDETASLLRGAWAVSRRLVEQARALEQQLGALTARAGAAPTAALPPRGAPARGRRLRA